MIRKELQQLLLLMLYRLRRRHIIIMFFCATTVTATSFAAFTTSVSPVRSLSLSLVPVQRSRRSLSSSLQQLLKDPTLIQQQEHQQESTAEDNNENKNVFSVYDPSASPDDSAATDILSQVVETHNQQDARQAIDRCHHALPSWRDGTTAMHRGSLLTRWSALVQDNADDLATLMTFESGKPLGESQGEVQHARSFLDYFAAEGVRAGGAGGGFLVPTPFLQQQKAAEAAETASINNNTTTSVPKGHIMAVRQAVGVSALIAPWNFPLAMITRKIGPALAAGCTAVVKPSELTPLSAIALKNLADRAGIPPGVFELV